MPPDCDSAPQCISPTHHHIQIYKYDRRTSCRRANHPTLIRRSTSSPLSERGGLTVTFFMWLMFWIPHPGKTVPVFEDIMAAFAAGNPRHTSHAGHRHGRDRVLRVPEHQAADLEPSALHCVAQKTEAFEKNSPRPTPRARCWPCPWRWAMAVNGGFIIGLVFVPGLWSVVEYLFPLAMVAFLAIGVLALETIWCVSGPCADRRWL